MPSLTLKFGQVRELLLENGFELDRQDSTSHGQYIKHLDPPAISPRVTLAGLDSDTIAKGTLASIIRQSGLNKKKFKNLLKSKKVLRAEARKSDKSDKSENPKSNQ